MPKRWGGRWWAVLALALIASLAALASPLAAAPEAQTGSGRLQAAFAAAARESGVPERVLLAVSYNVSRWEQHGGQPSTTGGYGVMHLRDVSGLRPSDGKGDERTRAPRPDPNDPSLRTLLTAAQLLGLSPDALKRDARENVRGGAALLAQYERQLLGRLPANEADWYGAVAKYSGSQEAAVALDFAGNVYATMRQGAARTTLDGQQVALPAGEVRPNTSTANGLQLRADRNTRLPECPIGLDCRFIPAAYQQNNPADPSDYGNYDLANREADGLNIRYIVIHDAETTYEGTIQIFQDPTAYVSAQYVIRSSDGQVTQMVENKNVAWNAGNWYINTHAIGIEHEGFAIEGATWYSEQMYRASAKLVRYLARRYNIPLDRAHIIGHDDVPGPTPSIVPGMHWDPGPFWDWARYMELVGAPVGSDSDPTGNILTINPNFATNRPYLTYCDPTTTPPACGPLPAQPSNFVYLRTAPSMDAPYITDQYLSGDPTDAAYWGDKAVTGQQFVRAGRQGAWEAIWYGGQMAWFYNPLNVNANTRRGLVITPRKGLASIPVYGRAYPEAAAYPAGTTPQDIVPIYTMPAGQRYVASGVMRGDYYWAPTYAPTLVGSDHVVVTGQTTYYQIFFNHRIAFVMTGDVDIVSSR